MDGPEHDPAAADGADYALARVEAVPLLRMAEVAEVPEEFDGLGVRNLDREALGTDEMKVKVWRVPPGDRMGVHGHSTQEEVYYVLDGRFEVRIGPPGETERREVGPGTVFAAGPGVARGYENVGDVVGRVLVVAAPNVEDRGIPEDELGE